MVGAALAILARGGIGGAGEAPRIARSGLEALGYTPVGGEDTSLEVDQPLAWALERASPGAAGLRLGRGEGGAERYRVRFGGGGEAVVTVGGQLWSVRRPAPTMPGLNLFPFVAPARLRAGLPVLLDDPSAWRLFATQSFREGGHLWYRGRFLGGQGPLPAGWRRELEVEIAGSSVVASRRFVLPLGTDLGVVTGRMEELRVLRWPALWGIGIAAIGVLLAGAQAVAFRERLAWAKGAGVGLATAGLSLAAGLPVETAAVQAAVSAAVVAVAPMWTELPATRLRLGPPAGAVLALAVSALPRLVVGLGGWMPLTRPCSGQTSPWTLASGAWASAFAEEPLLRGGLPGLAAPVLGWWGGALIGAGIGTLLAPLPAVPMVAGLAVELALQLGLVVVARSGGIGAAVLARGTCETLLRRPTFPTGGPWDRAALIGVALGLVLLAWPRRRD